MPSSTSSAAFFSRSQPHCVRDVSFNQDRCRVLAGARALAAMRNLVLYLILARARGHRMLPVGCLARFWFQELTIDNLFKPLVRTAFAISLQVLCLGLTDFFEQILE